MPLLCWHEHGPEGTGLPGPGGAAAWGDAPRASFRLLLGSVRLRLFDLKRTELKVCS